MAQNDLTLTLLRNILTNALTGGSISSELDQDDVINDAGRAFYVAHQWNFRLRPPVSLDFINGQDHIDLPDDFGEMAGLTVSNSLNHGITLTTLAEVAKLRSTTLTVTQNYYWAAVAYDAPKSRTQPMGPPRLVLWPTPGSSATSAVTVVYRARWMPLVNTDDVAEVPDFARTAFVQYVRAYVGGVAERLLEPRGGAEGLIDRLKQSFVWRDAVTSDGLLQTDYGSMVGGAIESRYGGYSQFSTAASSANPS